MVFFYPDDLQGDIWPYHASVGSALFRIKADISVET